MSVRTPLFDPRAYFESWKDPVLPGFAVFAAYVIVEFVAVVWLAFWLLDRAEDLPQEAINAMWNIVPGMFAGYLLMAAIAITVVTLIMHFWGASGGDGSWSDTFAVAGWSYAPNLLALPVTLAWTRFDLRDLTFDGSDPATFQAELDRISQDITGFVDFGIELVVIGWSVVILAHGVATIHAVDSSQAWPPAILIGVGALFLSLFF